MVKFDKISAATKREEKVPLCGQDPRMHYADPNKKMKKAHVRRHCCMKNGNFDVTGCSDCKNQSSGSEYCDSL
jgi:ferric iron reductase protein FhuF